MINWTTLLVCSTAGMIVTLVGIEVIRSIVDKKRRQRDGLGGTQDIVIKGLALSGIFMIAAIVSFVMLLKA